MPSANDSPTNICRFSIRHPSSRPDPLISSLWPTPDPGFAPALKAQAVHFPLPLCRTPIPSTLELHPQFSQSFGYTLIPICRYQSLAKILSIELPTTSKIKHHICYLARTPASSLLAAASYSLRTGGKGSRGDWSRDFQTSFKDPQQTQVYGCLGLSRQKLNRRLS